MLRLQAFFKRIVESSAEISPVVARIEKRLRSTNRVRQPVKISSLLREKKDGSTPVVVAKLLDDETALVIPSGLKIVALKWSHSVARKIREAGGQLFSIDQFMVGCDGDSSKLQIVQTDPSKRKSSKYWGPAPGEKGSVAYPRDNTKGKNKEKRIGIKKAVKFTPQE
ncbi:RL18 [Enterospora canceri]|uniref:RL18 n=1 Tax=Enterospora canceri TaxID=1081671 RepID=A0A1Y1S5M7_9MICR|nr:RL18 [Enterospora canceri]